MPTDEESGQLTSTQNHSSLGDNLTQAPTEGLRPIFEDPPYLDRLWAIVGLGLDLFLAFVELILGVVQEKHNAWYTSFVLVILLAKLYTLKNAIYRQIFLITFFYAVYVTGLQYNNFERIDIIRFAPVPCTLLALVALFVPRKPLALATRFIGRVRRGES
ncbi:hypothetical protein BKA65DRAFT_554988 [Rhexocercosporidium sp. MPI-PUGE-AT-0058]|nr:hypothetical protein BKA65DRAFT_554988 [Rhexocercosporidium sp. MPI-PUGE-AT-0058]